MSRIKCRKCKKRFKIPSRFAKRKYCSTNCRFIHLHKKRVTITPVRDKRKKAKTFSCINDAAKYIGCNQCSLSQVLTGLQNSTHGYKIKYAK